VIAESKNRDIPLEVPKLITPLGRDSQCVYHQLHHISRIHTLDERDDDQEPGHSWDIRTNRLISAPLLINN